MRHYEMLIDGHFIGGPCDYAVGKFAMKSPYDGRHVGSAAEGGWDEMNAAIRAASEASFPETETRASILERAAQLVREREDELKELLIDEIGKPGEAAVGEIRRTALTLELSANEARKLGLEQVDIAYDPRTEGMNGYVARFPVGPVLGIVPYNWPLNLAAHKFGPAFALGCPIVLKPSSQSPMSTMALARIMHEAGAPPGTVNAVVCPGAIAEMGARDPRIKKVSFTGSPRVGWKLKALLPDKRVTLELGGDAFAIVHEDAENLPEVAQKLAMGAFLYAGQICISIQHILVHASIYEELRSLLVEAVRGFAYGNPKEAVSCGPLISVQAADKVREWISEAELAGASAIAVSDNLVGEDMPTLIPPTLMEGVPSSVKLSCEEVFGPVATLSPFNSLDEAMTRVNSSAFGIHCGLYTQDIEAANRAFRDINVAGIVINENPTFRLDVMPYGGVRRSGFGREGVRYAMDEMTEWKSLVMKGL